MLQVKSIEELIRQLTKLPGIGPKTAQRLAYHMIFMSKESIKEMAQAMVTVKEKIVECPICCNITDVTPCALCQNIGRDDRILCVVEEPKDVVAMERSASYKGRYHVIHGSISPMTNIGPEDLRIRELMARIDGDEEGSPIEEVILATNPSVEGEATAMYIARLLKDKVKRISRLAHGLPIGGELEYADELTLSYALEGRKDFV